MILIPRFRILRIRLFLYTWLLKGRSTGAGDIFEDRKLASVYIGGGTPSSIPSSCIGRIMDAISSVISIEDDTEITIEANPGTLTDLKIKDYVSFSINRVSLGLQSARRGAKDPRQDTYL